MMMNLFGMEIDLRYILGVLVGFFLIQLYFNQREKFCNTEFNLHRGQPCSVKIEQCTNKVQPHMEELDSSLGSGHISQHVPQVWDAQGQNMVRINGCDSYLK